MSPQARLWLGRVGLACGCYGLGAIAIYAIYFVRQPKQDWIVCYTAAVMLCIVELLHPPTVHRFAAVTPLLTAGLIALAILRVRAQAGRLPAPAAAAGPVVAAAIR